MVAEGEVTAVGAAPPSRRERLKDAVAPLLRNRIAMVGLLLVLFWAVVAIGAPLLTRYGPLEELPDVVNKGPSLAHWLGTDNKGRDLWSRIAYGSQTIMVLAPLSVLCSLIIGATLGLLAGYNGGWVDDLVMRCVDAVMAFPTVLLYLIIIAAAGASPVNVVIAITVAGAPGIARLARGLALDIRTREYVAAARLHGESAWHIMFFEILPNARGPIIVDAALRIGYAVFSIGTLGFLGLGLPPPSPDWGSMVNVARRYVWTNPWAVLWPSLAISSLVVGLNLFADGLQEELGRYE